MIFQIEEQLNLAIAEKIESEMKKMHPGKVERIKLIESNGKFALKIIGSILESEVIQFMKTFFGKEPEVEVKKKDEVGGLGDIVGGLLGTAIQKQIEASINAQMPAIIETAQNKVDTIVSDFNDKSSKKLESLGTAIDEKFSQYTKGLNEKTQQTENSVVSLQGCVKSLQGTLDKLRNALNGEAG